MSAMEEEIPIQQHDSEVQNQELGFEHQSTENQPISLDPNPQTPSENPQLLPEDDCNEDDDDDKEAIRIICNELQDLLLSHAYHDLERDQSLQESDKCVGEDGGYAYGYGDHVGYGAYDEDDRSGCGIEIRNGGEEFSSEGEKAGGGGFYPSNGHGKKFVFNYPLRPDAEDCAFYMKTGTCKYGFHCKFNHPRRKTQWSKDKGMLKENNNPERNVQMECKYYQTSVGCKYGKNCKYNHNREKFQTSPIQEFNFLGLPMRPGEKECPYYMRTGSCKYGSNCRFHHPEPTIVTGEDSSPAYNMGRSMTMQTSSQSNMTSWSSSRAINETISYVSPMMYPPTQAMSSSYQATVYQASEKTLPTPPAFAMCNSMTEKFNLGEDYPERPGQPECSYFIKTGDCKYKSNCKFHHPKTTQMPRMQQTLLNDKGLPLRPEQAICSFYSRYGICKFGPACRFDHPSHLPASGWPDFEQPPAFGGSDGVRGVRKGAGNGNRSLVQQSV